MQSFNRGIDISDKDSEQVHDAVSAKLKEPVYAEKISSQIATMPLHIKLTIQAGITAAKEINKDATEVLTSLETLENELGIMTTNETGDMLPNYDEKHVAGSKLHIYPRGSDLGIENTYPLLKVGTRNIDISGVKDFTSPSTSYKIEDPEHGRLIEICNIDNVITLDIKTLDTKVVEPTTAPKTETVAKEEEKKKEKIITSEIGNDTKKTVSQEQNNISDDTGKENTPPDIKKKVQETRTIETKKPVISPTNETIGSLSTLPSSSFLDISELEKPSNSGHHRYFCSQTARENIHQYSGTMPPRGDAITLIKNGIQNKLFENPISLNQNKGDIRSSFSTLLTNRALQQTGTVFDIYIKVGDNNNILNGHRLSAFIQKDGNIYIQDSVYPLSEEDRMAGKNNRRKTPKKQNNTHQTLDEYFAECDLTQGHIQGEVLISKTSYRPKGIESSAS